MFFFLLPLNCCHISFSLSLYATRRSSSRCSSSWRARPARNWQSSSDFRDDLPLSRLVLFTANDVRGNKDSTSAYSSSDNSILYQQTSISFASAVIAMHLCASSPHHHHLFIPDIISDDEALFTVMAESCKFNQIAWQKRRWRAWRKKEKKFSP